MAFARFVGISMSRRAFCRLAFSGNQDDLYFFSKLSDCEARQPSLFFTADLMALARFVWIFMSRRAFCRLAFSGNQNDFFFFSKLSDREERQPSLFFTANLIALARLIWIFIRRRAFCSSAFSGDQDDLYRKALGDDGKCWCTGQVEALSGNCKCFMHRMYNASEARFFFCPFISHRRSLSLCLIIAFFHCLCLFVSPPLSVSLSLFCLSVCLPRCVFLILSQFVFLIFLSLTIFVFSYVVVFLFSLFLCFFSSLVLSLSLYFSFLLFFFFHLFFVAGSLSLSIFLSNLYFSVVIFFRLSIENSLCRADRKPNANRAETILFSFTSPGLADRNKECVGSGSKQKWWGAGKKCVIRRT